MSNEYFLTNHQEEIQRNICKDINEKKKIIMLEGDAGSGKTLLTYDIYIKLKEDEKNVSIIHCAILNDGQNVLKEKYKWDIFQVKKYKNIDFGSLDVLIVDEGQRIYHHQLLEI